MTRRDQQQYVSSVLAAIKLDIMGKLKTGAIPPMWQGAELSEYIKATACTFTSPNILTGQRKVDYKNDIANRGDL